MGAATRREARERGDRSLYRVARAAGYVARETPGGQYWVEAHGVNKLMDWQTAVMTAIAYHQLHELETRLALSKITLSPEQVSSLRDTFIERTTKTGWGAGEARRRMFDDAKRWVDVPTIRKAAATKAKSVVSSSEYHAAGVRQQKKAEARQRRAFAREGMAPNESLFGRVGSTAEAYKRIIIAEPRGTANERIHALVVKELGAKRAGPPSYVAWYRRWLVKHGYPTAAK